MEFLGRLIVSAFAIIVTSYIFKWFNLGVHIDGALTAVLVAAVLSLLNAVVKPLLIILTIPITVVTLGFFLLVINAVLILITSKLLTPRFEIDGFWVAFFFSLVLSVVNSIFNSLNTKREREK
jgi:putative membrane protein